MKQRHLCPLVEDWHSSVPPLSIRMVDFFPLCSEVQSYTEIQLLAKPFKIVSEFSGHFWTLVPIACSTIPKLVILLPMCILPEIMQEYELQC